MDCELCGEEILAHHVQAGVQPMKAHRECGLRNVLGGIGHLMDHAHFCGEIGDPDAGLSYRHSALLVDTWVHYMGIEDTVQGSLHDPPSTDTVAGPDGGR